MIGRRLDRKKGWGLLAAGALVGLVPRLLVAVRQYIEYDGWWHVFIAQQDDWSNFLWEVRANAHPPLYLLLLKAVMVFSRSRLAYRMVSLLAGLLAGVVLARAAGSQSRHWAVPGLVALAFSLSWNAIVVSCEVRSYMLCALFLAIAAGPFFALCRPHVGSAPRHSLLFCVATSLALLSHYSAALFLAAAGAVLLGRLAVTRGIRRRAAVVLRRAPVRVLLPVLLPAATAAALFVLHARTYARPLNHLPEFYAVSSGAGGPLRFLLRNTAYEVALFMPVSIPTATVPARLAACLAALAVVVGVLALPRRRDGSAPHRVAGALFLALVAVGMVSGVTGVYPWGGAQRHQFHLLPFILLFFAAGLDVALERVKRPLARAAILVTVATGLAGSFVAGWRSFPWIPEELASEQVAVLRASFPDATAVYVDQYSLIFLVAAYHDWTWEYLDVCPSDGWIQRFQLTRGERRMTVFRDRASWLVEPGAERFGAALKGCLEMLAPDPVVIFAVRQLPGSPPDEWLASPEAFATASDTLARSGLRAGKAVLSSRGGAVALELALATAPAS